MALTYNSKEKRGGGKPDFEETDVIVIAMRAVEKAEKRITYRNFGAMLCEAGLIASPSWTPAYIGHLNRLPGRLDALVCKGNHTQPNQDHLDHKAQVQGWGFPTDTELDEILEGIL